MNNTTDDQILEAMKRLANLLREAKREAGEAVVSAARKTELEAWRIAMKKAPGSERRTSTTLSTTTPTIRAATRRILLQAARGVERKISARAKEREK